MKATSGKGIRNEKWNHQIGHWIKMILLAATGMLAVAGQVLLMQQKDLAGILCYLAAMVTFCLAAYRNPTNELVVAGHVERKFNKAPVFVLSAFVLSFFVVSMVLDERPIAFQRWAEPAGWVVSLLLFFFGILFGSGWRFPRWVEIREKVRNNWKEIVLAAVIILAAFLVRTIDLTMHPYAIANDEGLAGLEALRVFRPGESSLFTTASAAMPKLTFLPTSLSILVFGRTFTAVRLPIALIGTLTVLFTYLAAREMFGKRVAAIAAVILAFLPVHVHFSRTGFYTIIFSYFPVLLIWLTLRAVRLGRMSAYLLAGAATAAAFYSHMGTWLAMAFPVFILGYYCIFRRGWLKQNWLNLLVFLGVLLLAAAPQAAFFFKHPDLFLARYRGVGVVQTGIAADQAAAASTSILSVLGTQLAKSCLAFISIGAPSGFYNSPQPYFMPVTAIFLMLGMGFTCMRIRRPSHLFLFVWFWSVIVLGGMLTTDAPASNRLVMAFPAAAILVSVGLDQFTLTLTRFVRLQAILIGAVILTFTVSGAIFYFKDYRINNWYGDASNELEYETIRMLKQLGPDYRLELLGEPEVKVEFPNLRFFLLGYVLKDVPADGLSEAAQVDAPVLYIAIPGRAGELRTIAESRPGGQWLMLDRRYAGNEELLYAYLDPPAALDLYRVQTKPEGATKRTVGLPAWAWWVILIAASVILDLVVLPRVWHGKSQKKPVERRGPWRWLHNGVRRFGDWLKK